VLFKNKSLKSARGVAGAWWPSWSSKPAVGR